MASLTEKYRSEVSRLLRKLENYMMNPPSMHAADKNLQYLDSSIEKFEKRGNAKIETNSKPEQMRDLEREKTEKALSGYKVGESFTSAEISKDTGIPVKNVGDYLRSNKGNWGLTYNKEGRARQWVKTGETDEQRI